MLPMADELQRELAALRDQKARAQDGYANASQAGMRLIRQFIEEMTRSSVRPYAVLDIERTTQEIPGRPGGLLRRGTSRRSEAVARYRFIDYGWTTGSHVHVEVHGPHALLDGPVVLQNGVIRHASWHSYDPDYDLGGLPAGSIVNCEGKHILFSTGVDDAPYVGTMYAPQYVARLMQHYLDERSPSIFV
jgi:hypothetical protein